MKSAQTLVVYYSRTGQNYTSDGIVNLEKGNTEVVAEQIQKLTGADIFRLETVKEYAVDYYECTQEPRQCRRLWRWTSHMAAPDGLTAPQD